jgi:hypothetical protein
MSAPITNGRSAPASDDELMTVAEVLAELKEVSRSTFYYWRQTKGLRRNNVELSEMSPRCLW